jgi:hypothetical protein
MKGTRLNRVKSRLAGGTHLLAALFLAAAFALASPLQAATPDRPLIGVSYFAGWWRPLPNKWNYDPAVGDWRARFPQRVPLLGEYNDQPTMDKEIVAAAEHGIDSFLILWYYNGPNESQEREKNSRFLNADYPYEKLAEFARPSRGVHGNDKIPYVPYLGAGFNARPWPDNRARFAIPTKDEWTRELRTMKADLQRLENLGFPLPDGRRRKALTIYAWNEFGEGGFLAPTKGEGAMKLRAIQEVFGRPQGTFQCRAGAGVPRLRGPENSLGQNN